jgi:hypothetical protein
VFYHITSSGDIAEMSEADYVELEAKLNTEAIIAGFTQVD